MTLTSLDYAILGLLRQKNRTGYQIRQIFETTAMGNYSSSPGSIYPAINKLKAASLVQKTDFEAPRSPFCITDQGAKSLSSWLRIPIASEDFPKNIAGLMLRFALMDNRVAIKYKLSFLEAFRENAEVYLDSLQKFRSSQETHQPMNGLLAVEHGIEVYRAHIRWASRTIVKLKPE